MYILINNLNSNLVDSFLNIYYNKYKEHRYEDYTNDYIIIVNESKYLINIYNKIYTCYAWLGKLEDYERDLTILENIEDWVEIRFYARKAFSNILLKHNYIITNKSYKCCKTMKWIIANKRKY